MKKFLSIAAVVTLAACGYSEDRFNDDLTEAWCEHLVECDLTEDTIDECIAEAGDEDTSDFADCDFDSQAARDCVQAVQGLECPDTGEFSMLPAVCGDVYTNCGTTEDTGI